MSDLPSRLKRLLLAAVAVAALAGAGVGIAAGFGVFSGTGAFNGISAAQHPPRAADKLDPAVAASFAPDLRRGTGNVRFVARLDDGVRIYAVAMPWGGLCTIAERLPGPHTVKGKPAEIACSRRLTQKRPTFVSSFLGTGTASSVSWGIALDSVIAVSFLAGGQDVTVPVKNNVWSYVGENAAINPLTVHFTNGSTETIA